jgi:hypothetical protein
VVSTNATVDGGVGPVASLTLEPNAYLTFSSLVPLTVSNSLVLRAPCGLLVDSAIVSGSNPLAISAGSAFFELLDTQPISIARYPPRMTQRLLDLLKSLCVLSWSTELP